jgi:hypothetical protein
MTDIKKHFKAERVPFFGFDIHSTFIHKPPSEGTRWGLNGRGFVTNPRNVNSGFPCLRSLLIGLTILSPGSLEALRWWFWLNETKKG